jgi:hypothetical protein
MNQIRIRAYWAYENLVSCVRFAKGHLKVLKVFGISSISSAQPDWMFNPGVIVIQAESLDMQHVYGGVRIHLANGDQPLPIETAVGAMDAGIGIQIMQGPWDKTAEICGYYNSKENAVWGIGGNQLIRTAVAVVKQMELHCVIALCAPYTVKTALGVGFEVAVNFGNLGKFRYPKEDILATAMVLRDPESLIHALPEERKIIFQLAHSPKQNVIIKSNKGLVELIYDLDLSTHKTLIS